MRMAFAGSTSVGRFPGATRVLPLYDIHTSSSRSRRVAGRPRPRHCRQPVLSSDSSLPASPSSDANADVDIVLPASVAAIRDARTGARVYLVGCVHGSTVSGLDVRTVIDAVLPDSVVLELCPGRLRALKKSAANGGRRRVESLGDMVKQFGGLGPALLGGSLSLIYTFQSWLGGDPGLEFKAALTAPAPHGSSIVCGDMKATRTVRRLFGVIFRPVRSLLNSPECFKLIADSVLFPPDNAISIPKVLLDVRRLPEVFRVFIPLFASISLLSTGLGVAATDLSDRLLLSPLLFGAATSYNIIFEPILALLAVLQPIFSAYTVVTFLSLFKVLVADRDKILANSIRKAAAAVSDGNTSTEKKEVVIVAVLGLMHLNGIIRRLESE